jgi:hypothetical protein
MDKLMHIDSYKIWSYDYDYKNGKKSKTTSIKQHLISEECIDSRGLINLLSDLNNAWHNHYHYSKNIKVEVTFEPHEGE